MERTSQNVHARSVVACGIGTVTGELFRQRMTRVRTEQVAADGQGGATVHVGYAACSSSECLPPVSDHPIALTIGH